MSCNNPNQKELDSRLACAIKENDFASVRAAVAAGADVNAAGKESNASMLSMALLHAYDIRILNHLLKCGADPNTILQQSVALGMYAKTKLLLEFGADMYVKNQHRRTQFMELISSNQVHQNSRLAELFVLKGYVPTKEDFEVITDIKKREWAVDYFTRMSKLSQEDKLSYLRRNTLTEELFAAARIGDFEEIKKTIYYGADMYALNDYGRPPFVYLLSQDNFQAMEYFIHKGYIPLLEDFRCIYSNSYSKDIIEYSKNIQEIKCKDNEAELPSLFAWAFSNRKYKLAEYMLRRSKLTPTKEEFDCIENLHEQEIIGKFIASHKHYETISKNRFVDVSNAFARQHDNISKNSENVYANKIAFLYALNEGILSEAKRVVERGYIPEEKDFEVIRDSEDRKLIIEYLSKYSSFIQANNAYSDMETEINNKEEQDTSMEI